MPSTECQSKSTSPFFVWLILSLQPLCFIFQLTLPHPCPPSQFGDHGFMIISLLVSAAVNVKCSPLPLRRRLLTLMVLARGQRLLAEA